MKVYKTIESIRSEILKLKSEGLSIGFVPTMGALHNGHLSLLKQAMAERDISVCSIFVNPIQFNNSQDLEKYPRTLDDDLEKLEKAGCDLVFVPSVEEMYPDRVTDSYDFGPLERVMEGEHRPGHFNGVAVVVSRLFEICLPDKAYFGEKDFQQYMIIKALVQQKKMPVEIIGYPIIREHDGLAMSSRNVRLTREERALAPEIFKTLSMIKEKAGKNTVEEVLDLAKNHLNALPGMKVEYLLMADENTLSTIYDWQEANHIRVFIATFLGNVRLIDNLKIK